MDVAALFAVVLAGRNFASSTTPAALLRPRSNSVGMFDLLLSSAFTSSPKVNFTRPRRLATTRRIVPARIVGLLELNSTVRVRRSTFWNNEQISLGLVRLQVKS
ncbi:hypothetical protein CLAIMM_02181 isoform 2 [Cladophialophora immunda]|nr:hypothetical protein CLAIMM_02181 isoform 2 [Cladophialophora immunda]